MLLNLQRLDTTTNFLRSKFPIAIYESAADSTPHFSYLWWMYIWPLKTYIHRCLSHHCIGLSHSRRHIHILILSWRLLHVYTPSQLYINSAIITCFSYLVSLLLNVRVSHAEPTPTKRLTTTASNGFIPPLAHDWNVNTYIHTTHAVELHDLITYNIHSAKCTFKRGFFCLVCDYMLMLMTFLPLSCMVEWGRGYSRTC